VTSRLIVAEFSTSSKIVPVLGDIWRSGGTAPSSLTSAVDAGERSASRPRRFIPREIVPLDRKLVGPQEQSGRCAEQKYLTPSGIRTTAVQPVDIPTELSRI
jgi:hypothetical protein